MAFTSLFPDAQYRSPTAIDLSAEEKPVFYFQVTSQFGPAVGPVNLCTQIRDASPKRSGFRPVFEVLKADPVTTRVLQLCRPTKDESLTKRLFEYAALKPPMPLLCWLVCVRAVEVADVVDALGEYGWHLAHGINSAIPAKVRLADCHGHFAETRRRIEWALEVCANESTLEYIDRSDAAALLAACEAAHAEIQTGI